MQLLSLSTTRAALRSLIFASSPPSFSSTPTPNKASGTSPGQRHSFVRTLATELAFGACVGAETHIAEFTQANEFAVGVGAEVRPRGAEFAIGIGVGV
ncbi:hypothetical protein D0Y65_018599 [Glycine soja]|uniref:Uncharacterized protein n=1 Tax=Glycine soja TaxID=3848 RepID=A0A445K092_GLYSO|nr:hypothetical protein D0Y65_018599 [Glycine soja]